MSNAVLMLCYNRTPEQLALSKETLASVFAQDVPVDVYVVDNGSTDETWQWLESEAEMRPNLATYRNAENESPVAATNFWLGELFGRLDYKHVLGIPNDVILPPNLYREFLKWPRGIVTGSMTGDRDFPQFEISTAVNECTPLAVVLFRRWVYEALVAKDGYFFDPRYFLYASDCDFALRLCGCGIRGVQLDLQYWHFCSASHRLVPDSNGAYGADQDRQRFFEKWGFSVSDAQYSASAQDINFKG